MEGKYIIEKGAHEWQGAKPGEHVRFPNGQTAVLRMEGDVLVADIEPRHTELPSPIPMGGFKQKVKKLRRQFR